MKRAEKMSELTQIVQEWKCSVYEAVYTLLFDFYEAAGFSREPLMAELSAMDEQQLIETFLSV